MKELKKKFTNIDLAQRLIKKIFKILRIRIKFIFKEVTIIIDNFDNSCINIFWIKKAKWISSFKRKYFLYFKFTKISHFRK